MKKLLLSFSLLFTISFGLTAQSIGIDSTAQNLSSLPDTINIGNTYPHNIRVINYSTTPLNGNISLIYAIDSGGVFISSDTVGVKTVSNFGLNDTTSFSFLEIYSFANSYKLGGNIVVVWPVADFGNTHDTLDQFVYIQSPNNIQTKETSKTIVFPNPFKNKINIKPTSKNSIKQVRIFNAIGQLVLTRNDIHNINLANSPKGVYFIELLFDDSERLYYKIIKE